MQDEPEPKTEAEETKPDTAEEEPKEPPQPELEPDSKKTAPAGSHWRHLHRLKAWYGSHKKWSIPATIIILLAILAGIPYTRYQAAGLVLKKDFAVQVTDATANTPVSGATVTVAGVSGTTDGKGVVTLHGVKAGKHNADIDKKYYTGKTVSVLVPILKQKTKPNVAFVATGRQVKIVISNLINSKKLDAVDIEVADTQAKTDDTGTAFVVLPATAKSEKATLKLGGYNDSSVTIQISNSSVKENDYKMTPAGKVYFLSKLSGTIDVVKTNLDGTDRKTVLAGTGSEDDTGTVLLASRDWKYLALLSQRAGNSPALYLIDTSDDSNTNIDSGDATFNLVGWSGDSFIYTVSRNNYSPFQAHAEALKSYNATTKQLTLLDQTAGYGSDLYNYASEVYGNVYEIGQSVVYEKVCDCSYSYIPGTTPVVGQVHAGIYSINTDGTNSQTLKTFDNSPGTYTSITSAPYETDQIYYEVSEESGAPTYYAYSNGKVAARTDIIDDFNKYYQNPVTYLLSPSGNNTFWSEPRDGKNTLFVGDQNGSNAKQAATLSDYSVYGWYTDNYLLVSKDSSELYIIPVSGIKSDSDAIKVTDYHKPVQNFYGYGGGYGGI